MSNTVNFNMRVDKDLKDTANQVFESYGMTMAQGFKMFLVNVAKTRSIPLSLNYQTDELPKANFSHQLSVNGEKLLQESLEAFQRGDVERYNSLEDLNHAIKEIAHG